MASVPTPEELVALFEKGLLAGEMARRFGLRDETEIQVVEAQCAALHQDGTLDLLQLVENNTLLGLHGPSFFMAAHFFCRILPELEETPARMMACVEALVTRGGDDGAANLPNEALRTWFGKDPHRAREVIAAARGGDGLASRHLTFALEAISDVTEARNIALAYDDARCLSAITALGRIDDNDPASRAGTLAAFGTLLTRGADDKLRANLLIAHSSSR